LDVNETTSRRTPGSHRKDADPRREKADVTTALAPLLTAADRCDRCGAQAYVRARLHAGGELLFCAHHGREHLPKLREHAEIHDESERLHESPASAPDDER
jgi:uncharacterized Zn finger protein (UPF0148 family)